MYANVGTHSFLMTSLSILPVIHFVTTEREGEGERERERQRQTDRESCDCALNADSCINKTVKYPVTCPRSEML